MAPVRIWGSDTTRSDLIKASCAVLGVEFEFVALDWAAKEHKSEAFLKARVAREARRLRRVVLTCGPPALQLNPFGQTPAFQDGDLMLVRPRGVAPVRRGSVAEAPAEAPAWLRRRNQLDPAMPPQTESGAIMLYLADKYGKGALGCDTAEKRAVLSRWVRAQRSAAVGRSAF